MALDSQTPDTIRFGQAEFLKPREKKLDPPKPSHISLIENETILDFISPVSKQASISFVKPMKPRLDLVEAKPLACACQIAFASFRLFSSKPLMVFPRAFGTR